MIKKATIFKLRIMKMIATYRKARKENKVIIMMMIMKTVHPQEKEIRLTVKYLAIGDIKSKLKS